MEENSKFNISSENNYAAFKEPKSKKEPGFGKTVLVPFISGVLGASAVLGTFYYVPGIKEKFIPNSSNTTPVFSSSANGSSNFVDISNYSETSVAVANKVLPSIVGITVTYQVSSFWGSSEAQAEGSGIIISNDGYILTNNHVISSSQTSSYYQITEASKLEVYLYNDPTPYEATVIGSDEFTDLAVIKIDKTDLTPATIGNSDNVLVGEFVMAVGNPLGMQSSVTSGIVSATNRTVDSQDGGSFTTIQTDAAINSGNSGGALVNSKGEVIGINTLKLAGNGIEGMGFAIPINSTINIVNQLIEFQTVKRGYIGITGTDVDAVTSRRYNLPQGVFVSSVEKDSPAEKAGLESGDVIIKVNDKTIRSISELTKVKYEYAIGETITITFNRDDEEKTCQLTLEEEKIQNQETESKPSNSLFKFGN